MPETRDPVTRAAFAPLLALALAACGAGCRGDLPARDQWLVAIGTDAPLPHLGDRLLVDVIAPDGTRCVECRRLFAVGGAEEWPIVLGVTPPVSGEAMVRARLYRSTVTGAEGVPVSSAVIDTLALLPQPVGVTRVVLNLDAGCFGVPADEPARTACDRRTGEPAAAPRLEAVADFAKALRPGSWATAQAVPCAADAPASMACIEGGVLILGDATLPQFTRLIAPVPERLVRVSPFFLDVDEVTVGEVRRLVREGRLARAPSRPDRATSACPYLGDDDARNDALPIACVSPALADAICAALGKRLPTEAEWELAAGHGAKELRFPWGDIADACALSIVARGRSPLEFGGPVDESDACRAGPAGPLLAWGARPGGSDGDVTAEGVRNLGGNVEEWVADAFSPYGEGCWSGAGLLEDPICPLGSGPSRSVRGGSWASVPIAGASAIRRAREAGTDATGFRCASPSSP